MPLLTEFRLPLLGWVVCSFVVQGLQLNEVYITSLPGVLSWSTSHKCLGGPRTQEGGASRVGCWGGTRKCLWQDRFLHPCSPFSFPSPRHVFPEQITSCSKLLKTLLEHGLNKYYQNTCGTQDASTFGGIFLFLLLCCQFGGNPKFLSHFKKVPSLFLKDSIPIQRCTWKEGPKSCVLC